MFRNKIVYTTLSLTLLSLSAGCDESSPAQHESHGASDTSLVESQSPEVSDNTVTPSLSAAYQRLVDESTAPLELIRSQLSRDPRFEGAAFPSVVDLRHGKDDAVFAHEVKVQRDGQDAGYVVVAVVEGRVRVHSYTLEGQTNVEALVGKLDATAQLNLQAYKYGPFDYLLQDADTQEVLAFDGMEELETTRWQALKQEMRETGYSTTSEPTLWSTTYGPHDPTFPGPEKNPGHDDPGIDNSGGGMQDPLACQKVTQRVKTKIVGNRDTPLWYQFKTGHYGGRCMVGCGPVAYAMYLAWAEKEWKGIEVFPGDAYKKRPTDKNKAGKITKTIGDYLDTFCFSGFGATPYIPKLIRAKAIRRGINRMLANVNTGSRRLDGFLSYDATNYPLSSKLRKEVVDKNRPAIVFGWSPLHDPDASIKDDIAQQHIYLVDGYRRLITNPSFCGSRLMDYRVNLGFRGKSSSRVWVGIWMVSNNALAMGGIRHHKR